MDSSTSHRQKIKTYEAGDVASDLAQVSGEPRSQLAFKADINPPSGASSLREIKRIEEASMRALPKVLPGQRPWNIIIPMTSLSPSIWTCVTTQSPPYHCVTLAKFLQHSPAQDFCAMCLIAGKGRLLSPSKDVTPGSSDLRLSLQLCPGSPQHLIYPEMLLLLSSTGATLRKLRRG